MKNKHKLASLCCQNLNVDGVVVVGVHQVDAAGSRDCDDGGSQTTLLHLDLHVQMFGKYWNI